MLQMIQQRKGFFSFSNGTAFHVLLEIRLYSYNRFPYNIWSDCVLGYVAKRDLS